ncbi:Uncharacterized protein APZ42_031199 [Daphnia magna]|uniref:Uncharacterized protein n=1 Tax=Daphnia magna TaxID=35525 RepID=A0A164N242_9CRUS|nr:Uncharacterized protein APZ42_031199 [Daphnia magna]
MVAVCYLRTRDLSVTKAYFLWSKLTSSLVLLCVSRQHEPKRRCLFCQATFTGKKGSKFCSKACYHDLQKDNCKQSSQIASCLIQGSFPDIGEQEIFSTPNDLSEPKKLRYEDLTSITEDKELSHLDSLSKDAISTKLGAALDFVRLQHERITKLESELLNAKITFANSAIAQFNSQQISLNSQAPSTQGLPTRPSYAQAARVQHAPVLVANFGKGCAPADRVSLEKMEQLLNSHAGGPVPSSVWQKDSTVFVRLNYPADFDREKSILEFKQNSEHNSMYSSIIRSPKLYPAVALFVDVDLLPGLKNELILRNAAFKGKIDSVTQIKKKTWLEQRQSKNLL